MDRPIDKKNPSCFLAQKPFLAYVVVRRVADGQENYEEAKELQRAETSAVGNQITTMTLLMRNRWS